jgi:hypothetical protein
MDITEIILFQHHRQRRMFSDLDELRDDPGDNAALSAVWKRLAIFLEVHAEAEERFFYPHLLKVGRGEADADDVEDEVEDAVKDHNEIRDAVKAAEGHEVGSESWWNAVIDARIANDDHMAEEERQDLADFRRHADLQLRHEIAVRFLTFEAQHATGDLEVHDKDPEKYVADNA